MPTLSLAIIVGAGEAFELDRCLASCKGDLFDEVVVAPNGSDHDVVNVALKYATKVPRFEWIKDFAAARNHCFSHCTGDYILWLDADDILTPANYRRLTDMKPTLGEAEVHFITYNYHHTPDGTPVNIHPRERIVKRMPEIRWEHPIHECLTIHNRSISRHPEIAVDHYREKPFNAKRNLEILEHACAQPNPSSRMRFYYAKEILDSGDWKKGEPIGRKLIDDGVVILDEAVTLCRHLAYGYLMEGRLDLSERYCYRGISASAKYAEFYCLLGDIAMRRKDDAQAIRYFRMALACDVHDGEQGHWEQYYGEVPARNLYLIYFNRGDMKEALFYNKFAIQGDPDNKAVRGDRDMIWSRIDPASLRPAIETKPIVAWLIPNVDIDNPSIRLRRYNVCTRLAERGVDSFIIHEYYGQAVEKILEEIRDANVVVFTQYGDVDYALAQRLRARGVRLCFDHCELIGPFPLQFETFAMVDALVCCSTALGEISKSVHGFTNAVIIKDSWE